MFKLLSALASSTLLALSVSAAPAWAGAGVTFVSGKGTDSGNCESPASPCRTFQFAFNQTNAGGEVKALDPANYFPVTITKSISIEGVGGASIADVPSGGSGITISAGPNDVINISGLTFDGRKVGQSGISTSSFGSLTVTHSTIRNFCDGIDIFAMSGKIFLFADVLVSDNRAIGLELVGVPGTLDHVTVTHNGGAATCGTSVVFGSIRAAQGAAVVSIVDSTVANNSAPIDSDDGATFRLYLSFIPAGVQLTGGTALSAGNNFIPPAGLTEVGTH